MNNTAWILKISRPRFWSYLVGPWAVGMVIAASNFSDFKALLFWIGFLFFLWPANFFLYGLNDFADQDTDYFNPKKSTYEARYRNSQNKPLILVITMIGAMALLFMWILPTWSSKFVLMLWLLLASFYSLPPIRFKSRLFFDSFSNVLYILPGLIIFLVYQPPSEISWPIFGAAWLWSMGMHLFSALPDISADKNAKVKTTAVWLGFKSASILTLLYFTAAVVMFSLFVELWLGLTGFVAYCLPTLFVYFNKEDSDRIMKTYKIFPLINAFCGGCLFVYVFFQNNFFGY